MPPPDLETASDDTEHVATRPFRMAVHAEMLWPKNDDFEDFDVFKRGSPLARLSESSPIFIRIATRTPPIKEVSSSHNRGNEVFSTCLDFPLSALYLHHFFRLRICQCLVLRHFTHPFVYYYYDYST
jgi:hypothetical protein